MLAECVFFNLIKQLVQINSTHCSFKSICNKMQLKFNTKKTPSRHLLVQSQQKKKKPNKKTPEQCVKSVQSEQ